MSDSAANDSDEKRYLLGESKEDEKTLMEEAFFADDSKFRAVELAEDELIDAFVWDKLSAQERREFSAKVITSHRLIERVHFARALAERADSLVASEQEAALAPEHSLVSPSAKATGRWWDSFFAQPAWRTALAACAVLFILASGVLVSRWWQFGRESDRLAAERAQLQRQKEELDKLALEQQTRNEQSTAEMQRERARLAERLSALEEADKLTTPTNPLPAGLATVFLTPGSLRSGGVRSELKLLPGTTTAQVFLDLERNDYPRYSVTIKGVDNDQVVFSKKGLTPLKKGSSQVLVLRVPASLLRPTEYNVSVEGLTASGEFESVEDYSFRVSPR